jgi:hypothetical protein
VHGIKGMVILYGDMEFFRVVLLAKQIIWMIIFIIGGAVVNNLKANVMN